MKLDVDSENTTLAIIPETQFEIVWLRKFGRNFLSVESRLAGNGNTVIDIVKHEKIEREE